MKMEMRCAAKIRGYGRLDALIVTALCGIGLLLLVTFLASQVRHRNGGKPVTSSHQGDEKARNTSP
ncbi:hypothetical protein [Pedosphaera parvula]|uniref:Uncharacterized protein n=1 Tax=Pedosphaera parvula (strain Ellin514) TaxID=320771 RepID=B9XLA9_PEDPL|nr:hypothetical protein [Pedosphaera parvula]EEF59312.1 hypothetical protein Cflav_PD1860 [Pedosphaera parvula Ellin514]